MAQSTQANAGFGLGALAKADDLKKRLLFTVGALIVYGLGTFIPLPGIDPVALSDVFGTNPGYSACLTCSLAVHLAG